MPESKQKKRTSNHPLDRGDSLLLSAAKLTGCPVERFLAWKLLDDGSLVVIDNDGRKYQFTSAELEG